MLNLDEAEIFDSTVVMIAVAIAGTSAGSAVTLNKIHKPSNNPTAPSTSWKGSKKPSKKPFMPRGNRNRNSQKFR